MAYFGSLFFGGGKLSDFVLCFLDIAVFVVCIFLDVIVCVFLCFFWISFLFVFVELRVFVCCCMLNFIWGTLLDLDFVFGMLDFFLGVHFWIWIVFFCMLDFLSGVHFWFSHREKTV